MCPNRDCKEEYRQRYINRGNNQSFLDVFIEGWDVMLDGLDCLGGVVIEIEEGHESVRANIKNLVYLA